MPFTSYSDLKTSIANYLARTDLTDQIPDFITFAENRLRRELRIRQCFEACAACVLRHAGRVAQQRKLLRTSPITRCPLWSMR